MKKTVAQCFSTMAEYENHLYAIEAAPPSGKMNL
nr:MAG TPA: hypothetical protein [Caudoviricetes sp.]